MLPSVSFSDRHWTATPSIARIFVLDTPFSSGKTADPSTIGAMAFVAAVGSKSGTEVSRRRRSV